ncbi:MULTISPECIES: copper resistance CopC family protein [Micromonospora]|uniref:copper resistance CopC family protein n=1 Tax=Micromonospora TaxID=1873 RepID=UPI001E4E9586|nr:copper resistance CopC family protein [Micromonospora yangpuensis]
MRTSVTLLGAVLGLSLLLPVSPAAAHNSFTGSDPRDGARLAEAPERVELRFLAKLPADKTKITITGPDDASAVAGEPTFSGSRVRVPFKPGPAGRYVVAYELPSADGHPIKGEVEFTLTTGAPAEPSPSPATPTGSPSATEPAAAPSPTASAVESEPAPAEPVPAADNQSDAGSPWLWVIGGLVLLAALGTGLLFRRRATRR